MKIAVVYLCVTLGKKTAELAARFVASYHEHPPGENHSVFVICNGGPLSTELGLVFASLHALFLPRTNDGGWDISGFIHAAKGPCRDFDMMLCLGESAYFHREGWLKRFAEAWERHGPGFYGAFSSNAVRGHLQTNGFAVAPTMLRRALFVPKNKRERYEFEHGTQALWRQLNAKGIPVMLVTWDGEYDPRQWRDPADILWRGTQRNCLLWNNHTDNWLAANSSKRSSWTKSADALFK